MNIKISEYGGVGDGVCDDTVAIQKSIDKCSEKGGGIVIFEAGKTFLSSGLVLKSNITLQLEKGSIIKGSGKTEEYITRKGPFERINSETSICALIYSKNTKNIKITGEGSIDGNYKLFLESDEKATAHFDVYTYPRPMNIYIENCENLLIEDITVQKAPFWTIHLVGCQGTIIDNINITNDLRMPNTDGIDIDRCKNTIIKNCRIVTGDDAICPKCTEETAEYGDCENLLVTNCNLTSTSSAIKFGSSSFGTFKNCIFTNINITNSNRGLSFQIRDTHGVENVLFSHINIQTKRFSDEWWGRGEPIYITCAAREEGMCISTIKNVVFEDIICETETGIFIYSDVEDAIQNIRFKNVLLNFKRQSIYELGQYDLRPWIGKPMIYEKVSPIYACHARDVSFENVSISDVDNILESREGIFLECKDVIFKQCDTLIKSKA